MEDSSMDRNQARTGFYILLKGCWHGIWTQIIGMIMAYLNIESYSRGDGNTHRILKFGLSPPLVIGFGYLHHDYSNTYQQACSFFFILKFSQVYHTSHNKWLSSFIVLLVLFTTKVKNSNMCKSIIYNINQLLIYKHILHCNKIVPRSLYMNCSQESALREISLVLKA